MKRVGGQAAWLAVAGGLVGCGPEDSTQVEASPAELGAIQDSLYEGPDPKLVFRYRASDVGTSDGVFAGTVGAAGLGWQQRRRTAQRLRLREVVVDLPRSRSEERG